MDRHNRLGMVSEPLTGLLWVVVAAGALALLGLAISYLIAALF